MLNEIVADPALITLEQCLDLEMDVEMYEEAEQFDISAYDIVMGADIKAMEQAEKLEEEDEPWDHQYM